MPDYPVNIVLIYSPWKLKGFGPRRLSNVIARTLRGKVRSEQTWKQRSCCQDPAWGIWVNRAHKPPGAVDFPFVQKAYWISSEFGKLCP